MIPIASSQDTIGPMCRTVADAAVLLAAIAGPDSADRATHAAPAIDWDLSKILDRDGLKGARIGVARAVYWGYHAPTDAIAEAAVAALKDAGAEIVDPADIPTAAEIHGGWPPPPTDDRLNVLLYEFKAGINAYLATRGDASRVKTLADLIAFNNEHRDEEMPYFGQELFEEAQEKGPLTDQGYLDSLASNQRLSRQEGIDAVLRQHRLDALVMPTSSPGWKIDLD